MRHVNAKMTTINRERTRRTDKRGIEILRNTSNIRTYVHNNVTENAVYGYEPDEKSTVGLE